MNPRIAMALHLALIALCAALAALMASAGNWWIFAIDAAAVFANAACVMVRIGRTP